MCIQNYLNSISSEHRTVVQDALANLASSLSSGILSFFLSPANFPPCREACWNSVHARLLQPSAQQTPPLDSHRAESAQCLALIGDEERRSAFLSPAAHLCYLDVRPLAGDMGAPGWMCERPPRDPPMPSMSRCRPRKLEQGVVSAVCMQLTCLCPMTMEVGEARPLCCLPIPCTCSCSLTLRLLVEDPGWVYRSPSRHPHATCKQAQIQGKKSCCLPSLSAADRCL